MEDGENYPDIVIIAESQQMRILGELKTDRTFHPKRKTIQHCQAISEKKRRNINPEKLHVGESGQCPSPRFERMEFGVKDPKVPFLGCQNSNSQLKGQ